MDHHILLASLVCLPAVALAQDQPPLKVRSETNAVQVEVSVRDAQLSPETLRAIGHRHRPDRHPHRTFSGRA